MPINGYFDTVFASSGTLVTVPDPAQIGGTISYAQGWPIGYSTPVASGGINISRGQTNQLFYDITSALQYIQQGSPAAFITSAMNLGTPFTYPKGAVVTYGGVNYQSLVNGNADVPPSSKWAVLPAGIAPLDSATLTGTPTAPTAAPGTNTTQLATCAFVEAAALGGSQTWTDVHTSRALGTTYTNSTGKPIQVAASIYNNSSSATASVGSVVVATMELAAGTYGATNNLYFIVPAGATYVINGTTIKSWAELR